MPNPTTTEVSIDVLLRALADVAEESANEIHELELGVTSSDAEGNPTVLGVPVMAGWRVFLLNYL